MFNLINIYYFKDLRLNLFLHGFENLRIMSIPSKYIRHYKLPITYKTPHTNSKKAMRLTHTAM